MTLFVGQFTPEETDQIRCYANVAIVDQWQAVDDDHLSAQLIVTTSVPDRFPDEWMRRTVGVCERYDVAKATGLISALGIVVDRSDPMWPTNLLDLGLVGF